MRIRILTILFAANILSVSGLWAQEPISQNTKLSVWANEAIVETYTYSFKDQRARFKSIAKLYTAKGWKSFLDAVESSKLVDTINQYKYSVRAVALAPPSIKNNPKSGKVKSWLISMPTLVYFDNPTQPQRQYLDVNLTVDYAPSRGERPFAINRFVAKLNPSLKNQLCKEKPKK